MSEIVNLPGSGRFIGGTTSLIAQVVASGTSTDTTIAAYTVPANSANAGTVYRFTAYGNSDNVATAGQINFYIKNNAGSKVATMGVATPAVIGTLKVWKVQFYLTYRTVGATGTYVIAADGYSQAATFGAISFPVIDQSATTTQDTTVGHAFTLGMNWTAALAGNILRADHAVIELVKP